MVQRNEGQLRYGKLLLSDGSVADYPTAFIIVENRTDHRKPSTWIIGANFLTTDAAEVLLGRMLAMVLACRADQGSGAKMRLVESIGELPEEDICSDVPEEVLVKFETMAKVSMKLEKLAYELENTKRS